MSVLEGAVKIARGDGIQHWADLRPRDRDTAELGVRRIAAAGYRILAPGELDRETVEQCAELIENGYDKPVGKPWRKDGKPSKNDECPHGRYMYEDCEPCAVIALRSLAGSKDKEGVDEAH